jgi:hypothetical protein
MAETYLDQYGYLRFVETKKLVHRTVCRQKAAFPRNWDVHHVDGNKLNNAVDNLVPLPRALHAAVHRRAELPSRHYCEALAAPLLHAYRKKKGRRLTKKQREARKKAMKSAKRRIKRLPRGRPLSCD